MTEKTGVTMENAVAFLNEARDMDPQAITKLVQTRVGCNENIAKHPTIQVLRMPEKEVEEMGSASIGIENGSNYMVGLVGIFNGLFMQLSHSRTITVEVNKETGGVLSFGIKSI